MTSPLTIDTDSLSFEPSQEELTFFQNAMQDYTEKLCSKLIANKEDGRKFCNDYWGTAIRVEDMTAVQLMNSCIKRRSKKGGSSSVSSSVHSTPLSTPRSSCPPSPKVMLTSTSLTNSMFPSGSANGISILPMLPPATVSANEDSNYTDTKRKVSKREPASAKVNKCKGVFKQGPKANQVCGVACSGDYCGVHQPKDSTIASSTSLSTTVQPTLLSMMSSATLGVATGVPVGAQVGSKRPLQKRIVEKMKVTSEVIKSRIEDLNIRRNCFGNFELFFPPDQKHNPSDLLWDPVLSLIYGKQNFDGSVDELTDNDVSLCKELGLPFKDSKNLLSQLDQQTASKPRVALDDEELAEKTNEMADE